MSVLKVVFPKGVFIEEEASKSGLDLAFSLAGKETVVMLSPSAKAAETVYAATTFVYVSPVTGSLTLGYASIEAGYYLRSHGIDALVLSGTSKVLSLVSLSSRSVLPVPRTRNLGNLQFSELVRQDPSDTVLSVGRAAMNGVVNSSLRADGKEITAPGLGAALARQGIKGLLFPGVERKKDRGRNRGLCKKARRFLEEGDRTLLEIEGRTGALPVRNWSGRRGPRVSFFSEKAFQEDAYDSYPDFREASLLGMNLGVFNVEEVLELAGRVSESGLDTAYAGAVLAGQGLDHQGKLRCLYETAEGSRINHPVLLSERGLPFTSDLRGSYAEAVLACYELPSVLLSSRLLPSHPLSMRKALCLMLYETVYNYALLSEGYTPEYALRTYWGHFPSVCFNFPLLLTLPLLFETRRLRKGFRILERLERGPYRLPSVFRLEGSADGRALNQTMLLGEYFRQKERLRRLLKLRSENTSMPSGDSNAAVGPEDDLGREGDPGLRAIIPFLS